jgi:uncharacterized membrane protein
MEIRQARQVPGQTQQQLLICGIPLKITFWIILIGCGGMLIWLSIARYSSYNAKMHDLGNMAQAIWSATQGQPLVFTQSSGAYSRLSGHAEIIYFLFSPFYALWPDPRLLLSLQAILFVLGAIPVYRMALRYSADQVIAQCLALIYLFYPVAQTAVLFDFHGDTLAMPLLLFALDALEQRAWRRYIIWIALALSCKVYIAVAVAAIGAYTVLWGGQRRVGLLTIAAALVYGTVIFFGVRPFFASNVSSVSASTVGYFEYYFGEIAQIADTMNLRGLTAVIVFGPVMLIAWRGWRWLLVGLPIATAVFISTGPGPSYDFRYHHYALVVPFIIAATLYGLYRTPASHSSLPILHPLYNKRFLVLITTGIVILAHAQLVDTPLNARFWQNNTDTGRYVSVYDITSRDRMKDRFLDDHVPGTVPLAASTLLAPHLANRETLYLVKYPEDQDNKILPSIVPDVDYILADALFDNRILGGNSFIGGSTHELSEIEFLLRNPDFGLIQARDGLLLFQRDAIRDVRLTQEVTITTKSSLTPKMHFGPIQLVNAEVLHLYARRFRATFDWQITMPFTSSNHYLAISQLDGVENARIVHLPTYALHPTPKWRPGAIISESFDVILPDEIPAGSYAWLVSWYDLNHSEAYATDECSRIPESQIEQITMINVP